jgi:hypothetical protein
MNESNGNDLASVETKSEAGDIGAQPEIATRDSKKKSPGPDQKRIVLMAAGGLVVALLAFVLVSVPHKPRVPKSRSIAIGQQSPSLPGAAGSNRSSVPVTDSAAAHGKGDQDRQLREQDVQRTATPSQPQGVTTRSVAPHEPAPGTTLGAVPPFDGDRPWQAPPYAENSPNNNQITESPKSDRDLLEKSSLVFVRSLSSANSPNHAEITTTTVGLGLPTGTRLRARLETVATSAVKLPAIAIIEYNYERNGRILIPAGTKAFGRVEQADRTGYMAIRFDTLLMPDGAEVPFEAVATDLELAPLRGKVQGKNTGKSILARSLSGIGQAGTLFAGRGNLNQPFSEQDLVRERVATNIGEESDREVSHLAIAEHIVVSVPAGTPIYVVLQQTTKSPLPTASTDFSTGGNPQNQVLLQLLQKQLSGGPIATGHTEQSQ